MSGRNRCDNIESLLRATKSPIERDFLVAFCDAAVARGYRVGLHASSSLHEGADATIGIWPQKMMFRYVLDFAITFWFRGAPFHLAIECDGHEFHQKTKEQADRDTARERAISAWGYRVLRFTGRQINADAKACAMEALGQIMDWQTARLVSAVKGSAA
jgi:very-short-patch-repair endonuclease